MPMDPGSCASGTGLASELKTAVQGNNLDFEPKMGDQMDWLFDAIASAVITHITTNQVVVTSVTNTAAGVSPAETYLSGVGTSTSIT